MKELAFKLCNSDNYAPICLSTSTVRAITKQTLTFVLSNITTSTKNGTQRNIKNLEISEIN